VSNEKNSGDKFPKLGTHDEALEAAEVDAKVEKILRAARTRNAATSLSTEKSIREGKEWIEHGRQNSLKTLRSRVERKELICEDDLRARLGVSLEWISDAVAANILFCIQGPSGEKYFPAFYSDAAYDRQSLGIVCKRLGNLPGASKYHFFTSKSTYLGTKTPLEALAEGNFGKVLNAAAGFAER
jgi:hypothetical protein